MIAGLLLFLKYFSRRIVSPLELTKSICIGRGWPRCSSMPALRTRRGSWEGSTVSRAALVRASSLGLGKVGAASSARVGAISASAPIAMPARAAIGCRRCPKLSFMLEPSVLSVRLLLGRRLRGAVLRDDLVHRGVDRDGVDAWLVA